MAWNSSTTPLSDSYLASRFRSWPKCFLAAVFIASSRVAMSTERSIPLSLATWSRTRLRLMLGFCGVVTLLSLIHGPPCKRACMCTASRSVLPLELELEIRLGDLSHRDAEGAGALHLDGDRVLLHPGEQAGEVLAGRLPH